MEKLIVNNYGSFDVVLKKGKGSTLYATNGRRYIDFVSGIGVNCLGHNYKPLAKAISAQVKKQIHISNYYFSDTGLDFANNFCHSQVTKVHIWEILGQKQTKQLSNWQENMVN